MCAPIVLGAALAIGSVVGNIGANKAAKEQVKALNAQNQQRADEIATQAGQELTERARAARRERGSARAAASAAGVNLDSGSFLAMLQTSEMNQSNDNGVILYNERNAQRARDVQYRSNLSQIQIKTPLGIALDAGTSFASGYLNAGGKPFLGKNPGKG